MGETMFFGAGRRSSFGWLYHFLTAEKKLCGIMRNYAVLSGTDFTGFDRAVDCLFTAYACMWARNDAKEFSKNGADGAEMVH